MTDAPQIRIHPQWAASAALQQEGTYQFHVLRKGEATYMADFRFLWACDRCHDYETNSEQAGGWEEPCPKCGIKRVGPFPSRP